MAQLDNGKAFEYSIAKNYFDHIISLGLIVELVENSSLNIAKSYYDSSTQIEKQQFDIAAKNTINTLLVIEPGLIAQNGNLDVLKINIAADSQGQIGDVRDIVFKRENSKPKWEIGISAKNNHEAVKHSRLSHQIDFGEKWLGIKVSKEYFNTVTPIFNGLEKLRKESKATKKWSELGDYHTSVYVPVLKAFVKELKKLNTKNKSVPSNLVSYLMGNKDFYKVIKSKNTVEIHAYNIN